MRGEARRRQRPPTILTVDDDAQVLDAVVADLRSRYGRHYRVTGAMSGDHALAMIDRLRLRGQDLALIVADQRMPGLTGTEVLRRAKQIFPDVKSVLLTAYADTSAAITAINEIRLDHYVMKPWDPPEEHLFPVLDELLEAWQATRPPTETGLRLVGERWSAASHRLRDFLARSLLPFRWIDVEDAAAGPVLAAAGETARLPLLVLDDGTTLSDPSPADVAAALGLSARPEVEFFDVVIVGAGPAGLATAVYAASEGLGTVVVEEVAPGGQAASSASIENYLGFPTGISGGELARRAYAQARRFGSAILSPRRATGLRREDPYRVVELDDGTELHCTAVVLAMGVQYQCLDAPGVAALTGAGVYYGAAATEAAAMKGERVLVVGGANSAGQAALHLSRFADEVVVVARAPALSDRMSRYLVDRIAATPNIAVRTKSRIIAALGNGRLERVRLSGPAGEEELGAVGMFVFVGAAPRTDWLGHEVARDDPGYIITGPSLRPDRWSLDRDPYLLETSMPGVFAIGDVRARSTKRIASAVGEGSIAVQLVHEVLRHG